MKVFAYNIETGVRGELLDEINCTAYGSYGMKLPEVKIVNNSPEHTFTVVGKAEVGHSGKEVTAKDFGRKAVCFCTGKKTCGTDSFWDWVILVQPLEVSNV